MRTEGGGGDELRRRIGFATAAGLAAVEAFLVPRLQHVVGIHNPTHKSGVKYKRKSKSGAKTHTTFDHGAPTGGPPYTRTTTGMQAIASEMLDDGQRLLIGVRPEGKHLLMLDAGINYAHVGMGVRSTAYRKAAASGRTDAARQIASRAAARLVAHDSGGTKRWPWATSTVLASMDTITQLFLTGAH